MAMLFGPLIGELDDVIAVEQDVSVSPLMVHALTEPPGRTALVMNAVVPEMPTEKGFDRPPAPVSWQLFKLDPETVHAYTAGAARVTYAVVPVMVIPTGDVNETAVVQPLSDDPDTVHARMLLPLRLATNAVDPENAIP
jgi:hypothetical protein